MIVCSVEILYSVSFPETDIFGWSYCEYIIIN